MQSLEMSMRGKVCIVTGANSGIGKETVAELAKMGASPVMVCRNREKGEAELSEARKESGNDSVDLLIADLSSLQSVRGLVDEFRKKYSSVHVLVNNAGLFNVRRHLTVDGYEMTFAVNYLSPFLLTNLLLDRLKQSAPSRIVNVSSVGHYNGHINFDDLQAEKSYGGWAAYSQSKLALVLFTRLLARKLEGTWVTVNSLHPGTVATNIWSRPAGPLGFIMKIPKLFMTGPREGAETPVYLASSPEVNDVSGEYFEKKKAKKSSEESYDEGIAEKLWNVTMQLVLLD